MKDLYKQAVEAIANLEQAGDKDDLENRKYLMTKCGLPGEVIAIICLWERYAVKGGLVGYQDFMNILENLCEVENPQMEDVVQLVNMLDNPYLTPGVIQTAYKYPFETALENARLQDTIHLLKSKLQESTDEIRTLESQLQTANAEANDLEAEL